jgi:hypothetical protein
MNYKRRSDVRVEDVAGETLVLDDQAGQIHQLNCTASFVWGRCDGKTSVDEIVALMAAQFDVDEKVARNDVVDVIRRLGELKLLSE